MHHTVPHHPVSPRRRSITCQITFALVLLIVALAPKTSHAQQESATDEKKKGALIRILCVQCCSKDDEEITLATKSEDAKWTEHDTATLRSPFISSWLRVPHGTTHLVKKDGDAYHSFGSFLIPQESKHCIVILFPDLRKNTYRCQVLDPGALTFQKGKALILNYGKVPAVVMLGQIKLTVHPGQNVVEKITTEKENMYRLLIGHLDKDKTIVPCYDRYISHNPETRKSIFLFPDESTGLRAMSLSEFGPFE